MQPYRKERDHFLMSNTSNNIPNEIKNSSHVIRKIKHQLEFFIQRF